MEQKITKNIMDIQFWKKLQDELGWKPDPSGEDGDGEGEGDGE